MHTLTCFHIFRILVAAKEITSYQLHGFLCTCVSEMICLCADKCLYCMSKYIHSSCSCDRRRYRFYNFCIQYCDIRIQIIIYQWIFSRFFRIADDCKIGHLRTSTTGRWNSHKLTSRCIALFSGKINNGLCSVDGRSTAQSHNRLGLKLQNHGNTFADRHDIRIRTYLRENFPLHLQMIQYIRHIRNGATLMHELIRYNQYFCHSVKDAGKTLFSNQHLGADMKHIFCHSSPPFWQS